MPRPGLPLRSRAQECVRLGSIRTPPTLTFPFPHELVNGTRRILLPLLVLVVVAALARVVAPGLGGAVVFDDSGDFGRVRVVESRDGLRVLYTGEGRARQSAIYPGRPLELVPPYLEVAAIGTGLAPPDGRILFVGLGGGALPMFARHVWPAAHLEAVEIDPLIVEVAVRYFGFRSDERLAVHVGDGRAFLERSAPERYDLIVLDAFSDDDIPLALTTLEFLLAVRDALAPGGVVVSNLWTANPSHPSMVATYQSAFEAVHTVDVPARRQTVLFAGHGDRDLGPAALVAAARALRAAEPSLGFDPVTLVDRGYRQPPTSGAAPILRDQAAATVPR
jgi:spermidine synthase